MGSIDREVRERQKEVAVAVVEKRVAELKAAGVDEKKLEKDIHLRHAKANLRKALNRIRAIDARAEIAVRAAQQKAEEKNNDKTAKASKAETESKTQDKKGKDKKA